MARFQEHTRIPRFYHASPLRFRRGTILTGNREGGYGSAHPNVCLTDSPAPHATVASKAIAGNWYVYQVEPYLCDVIYVADNGEYQATAVRVIDQVGRCQALAARRHRGAIRDKYDTSPVGKDASVSYIHRPRPLRGVRVHPFNTARNFGRRYR